MRGEEEMADYARELKEYVGKLQSQIVAIDKILQLNSYGLIEYDVQKQLKELRNKAAKLQKKLENNEFEIAIVGLEKAGKSTFANALMGSDILPSKDARCTYTSTSIRYGNDEAKVEFFTRKEFENSFREKLKILEIPCAESLSFEVLSLEKYQSMFEDLSGDKKKLYGGTINKDIEDILKYKENISKFLGKGIQTFSGVAELEGEYFKGFIQNPKYAIAVKEITLNSGRLMSDGTLWEVHTAL